MNTKTVSEAAKELLEALKYTPLGISAIKAVAAVELALANEKEANESDR